MRAFAVQKRFRRIEAADAEGSRAEGAAVYRPPADARIHRKQPAKARDDRAASRDAGPPEAAPEAACTMRSWAPACGPAAESTGAKPAPSQTAARPTRVR